MHFSHVAAFACRTVGRIRQCYSRRSRPENCRSHLVTICMCKNGRERVPINNRIWSGANRLLEWFDHCFKFYFFWQRTSFKTNFNEVYKAEAASRLLEYINIILHSVLQALVIVAVSWHWLKEIALGFYDRTRAILMNCCSILCQ